MFLRFGIANPRYNIHTAVEKVNDTYQFAFRAPLSLMPDEMAFRKWLNKSDPSAAKESLRRSQWSLVQAIKQHELAKQNYERLVGASGGEKHAEDLQKIERLERTLRKAKQKTLAQSPKEMERLVEQEKNIKEKLMEAYKEQVHFNHWIACAGTDQAKLPNACWDIKYCHGYSDQKLQGYLDCQDRLHSLQLELDNVRRQMEALKSQTEQVQSLEVKIRDKKMPLIIAENTNQSDRIVPFYGSSKADFRNGENAIVSFPGVHGYGWMELTKTAVAKDKPLLTSCVFLPDEKAPGYGKHDFEGGSDVCNCHRLYGQQEKWGCRWYTMWKNQTFRAHAGRCNLIVVTKKDGSLGKSQQGEVRFLDSEEMPYKKVSIKDFAMMLFSPKSSECDDAQMPKLWCSILI